MLIISQSINKSNKFYSGFIENYMIFPHKSAIKTESHLKNFKEIILTKRCIMQFEGDIKMTIHLGLDVGSTTVKLVALDNNFKVIHQTYTRHMSDVKTTMERVFHECFNIIGNANVTINVTGSGGLYIHKYLGIPFIQEVVALSKAISTYIEHTDVAIELGGEDSKILYLTGSIESRMNSICAGGTGAFIDQMATLLNTDAKGLDILAKGFSQIHPIASRCGVFAKTDVQALINQCVSKEDIAMSVLQSVVHQTISNLAWASCKRQCSVFRRTFAFSIFSKGKIYQNPQLK